jgi:large subunit ribosomal protein L30
MVSSTQRNRGFLYRSRSSRLTANIVRFFTNRFRRAPPTHTHFRVTLRLSGISVGKPVQGTLAALGLQRRMQSHMPEAAGMILAVNELVEVQNVPAGSVRTAVQQRKERDFLCGFAVVGSKREGSSASGLTL